MAAERQPVAKSAPVTLSERYLETLSARSFLSLWSYPRIFRDQHSGKEICDLLVVFDDNVIIFSDKHCVYKNTGRPSVDWTRWSFVMPMATPARLADALQATTFRRDSRPSKRATGKFLDS